MEGAATARRSQRAKGPRGSGDGNGARREWRVVANAVTATKPPSAEPMETAAAPAQRKSRNRRGRGSGGKELAKGASGEVEAPQALAMPQVVEQAPAKTSAERTDSAPEQAPQAPPATEEPLVADSAPNLPAPEEAPLVADCAPKLPALEEELLKTPAPLEREREVIQVQEAEAKEDCRSTEEGSATDDGSATTDHLLADPESNPAPPPRRRNVFKSVVTRLFGKRFLLCFESRNNAAGTPEGGDA